MTRARGKERLPVGARIRALREALGLSQRELGEAIGVAQNVVARFESDSRRPSLETLSQLCDALGTTSDALLGRPNAEQGGDSTVTTLIKITRTMVPDDIDLLATLAKSIRDRTATRREAAAKVRVPRQKQAIERSVAGPRSKKAGKKNKARRGES